MPAPRFPRPIISESRSIEYEYGMRPVRVGWRARLIRLLKAAERALSS